MAHRAAVFRSVLFIHAANNFYACCTVMCEHMEDCCAIASTTYIIAYEVIRGHCTISGGVVTLNSRHGCRKMHDNCVTEHIFGWPVSVLCFDGHCRTLTANPRNLCVSPYTQVNVTNLTYASIISIRYQIHIIECCHVDRNFDENIRNNCHWQMC